MAATTATSAAAAAVASLAAKSVAELEQDAHVMDRYSRQIGAFGMEAMLKLVQMRVLFIGMRGVGVETAKNTVLAGARQVTLYDPEPVAVPDLGSNFFLVEGDVGKPRATATAPRLAELNPLVRVEATNEDLTEDLVARHDAVIITSGLPQSEVIRWNEFCRTRTKKVPNPENPSEVIELPSPIAFIRCFTGGAMGSVFVDHGPGFVVRDSDGKEPLVKIITEIECLSETVALPDGSEATHFYTLLRYLTPDGQPPGSLRENCLVELSEVAGMHAPGGDTVNEMGPFRTYTREGDPVNSVRIGDLRSYSPYLGGGVMTEVKEPHSVPFRSLAACTLHPATTNVGVICDNGDQGFVMTDMMSQFAPGGVEQQLHVALQGVYAFEEKHGRLPQPNNAAEEDECLALARHFNETLRSSNALVPNGGDPAMVLEEINETTMRRVARYAAAELQPMCAFFGGVVAQELVKMSGKFTPIQQFFNYNVFGALPDDDKRPADTASTGSRYDNQVAVFGRAFQERLGNLNVFMVGCGALGCEYAKNFALMGVCCGPTGQLHITDNDRIEVSNLSRQFLFREENVGQPKSVAASQRAQHMNKDIKIDARQDLVGPDTEHIFDDAFWENLDLVCNALDNMKARFYVDDKCVFYEKPLLESGTMGTGANVDVVVPHKTRSYTDGGNADEGGGIPMCTLRNFPHLIDHCIEWSRAKFSDLFVTPAQQLQLFLDDPFDFLEKLRAETVDKADPSERANAIAKAAPRLRLLRDMLAKAQGKPTMKDCVEMAYRSFYELFRDNILDLIDKFPQDAKTSSGEPFWSGHKKFPVAVEYDSSDELHVAYVQSAANLFACMLKVHPDKHPSEQNKLFPDRWMAPYRDSTWLNNIVAKLETPAYHRGAVADLDEETAGEDVDDAELVDELEDMLKEMEAVASAIAELQVEPLDFEKDDDDNFHIDFIAACANLRAINYRIPTTTRHKCKMIAGRIIPAVATATASVTGLVMMEFFKILQDKPIEALRNGNYDIGTNTYMMFEADPPKKICSRVIKTKDEVQFKEDLRDYGETRSGLEERIVKLTTALQALAFLGDEAPAEARAAFEKALGDAETYMATLEVPDFDDYVVEEKVVAYPDPHDKWEKIVIPQSITDMDAMVNFFLEKHGLTLQNWSMSKRNEDGKVTGVRLFPPEATIDPTLLPDATESMATATRAIMTNPKIPGNLRQKYIQAWRKLREGGSAPAAAAAPTAGSASLKRMIQDRTGMDLSKRSRLLLENVGLVNADGDHVTTADIVLEL